MVIDGDIIYENRHEYMRIDNDGIDRNTLINREIDGDSIPNERIDEDSNREWGID